MASDSGSSRATSGGAVLRSHTATASAPTSASTRSSEYRVRFRIPPSTVRHAASALPRSTGYAKVRSCGALLRGHICAGMLRRGVGLRGARRKAVFH